MSLHDALFWGVWNNQGASRGQNFLGQTGTPQNMAMASAPSLSKPSYQEGRHQGVAYCGPWAEDASVGDVGVEFQSVLPIPVSTAGNASLRRDKLENLDRKARKKIIESLYMEEDKTLVATMDIMKNSHSFEAT